MKNFGKSSRGRSQGLQKIFTAPEQDALLGHLCELSFLATTLIPQSV